MTLVSILGDSISTYEGCNPSGYAVFYDAYMQKVNGLESVNDTWWAIVKEKLNASVCVNNSYSGSMVTGYGFPAASSQKRTHNLGTEQHDPDYILIYIGFNDFGHGVQIKNEEDDVSEADRCFTFEDAYELMIERITQTYPKAVIICGTLLRTAVQYHEGWRFPEKYMGVAYEDYSRAIRLAAKNQEVMLADLAALNIRYETLDGTHPTKAGHQMIADAWLKCLENLGILMQ